MALNVIKDLRFSNLLSKIPDKESAIKFCEEVGLVPSPEDFLRLESHSTESITKFGKTTRSGCNQKLVIQKDPQYKLGWRAVCQPKKNKKGNKIGCGKTFNPTENTWIERAHLSIQEILLLTMGFILKLFVTFVMKDIGVVKTSAIAWYQYCRLVCGKYVNQSGKIGGPGMVVQIGIKYLIFVWKKFIFNILIDESHVYERKYKRGRYLKNQRSKVWVVGAIDENGQIFMEKVIRRNKTKIHDIIRRRVHELSVIHSDCWGAYYGVEKDYNPKTGFGCNMSAHFQVNHSKRGPGRFVEHHYWFNPNQEADDTKIKLLHQKTTTNRIERVWRELKKHIRCNREYFNLKEEFISRLDEYIDSFVYVFEC